MAERVRARHRIAVALLKAIGVPEEAAEMAAEGIAQHVSDTTLAVFAACLGQSQGAPLLARAGSAQIAGPTLSNPFRGRAATAFISSRNPVA